MLSPLAGQKATRAQLEFIPRLVSAYYTSTPRKPVSFGTSGHRGSSLDGAFQEAHIAATTQAIVDYRRTQGITGPVFLGFDTHALSYPAYRTAVEVLVANGLPVVVHQKEGFTPTPVISFEILSHNLSSKNKADGIVITPSHNPPADGGFKYNPPHGGPADTDATGWIQKRANELMLTREIARMPFQRAIHASNLFERDFITPFVSALGQVVDMAAIKSAGIKIGVDPLGGAGINYWEPIINEYGLDLTIVNQVIDPTFSFMFVDEDGRIRMDCSSQFAMKGLIELTGFDIKGANDTDFDRHGIADKNGLMNPNHYISVALWHLLQNRPHWKTKTIGKTAVSSSMIDRVVQGLGGTLYEVPVGFKWFVQGLLDGTIGYGGEESAGASFLKMDGSTWTTDKDGFSSVLLAAEIMAKHSQAPSEIYRNVLIPQYGEPYYGRTDIVADGSTPAEIKAKIQMLMDTIVPGTTIAGKQVVRVLTKAPGNGASIEGLKVILDDGSWFAVRPSGTEPKVKLYIESFQGREHYLAIKAEIEPRLLPR